MRKSCWIQFSSLNFIPTSSSFHSPILLRFRNFRQMVRGRMGRMEDQQPHQRLDNKSRMDGIIKKEIALHAELCIRWFIMRIFP